MSSSLIITLAREITTMPYNDIYNELVDYLRRFDYDRQEVLFDYERRPCFPNGNQHVLHYFFHGYMSWQISRFNAYNFNKCVKTEGAQGVWEHFLDKRSALCGRDIFFDLLRKRNKSPTWNDVLNNKAAILADAKVKMTTQNFVTVEVLRVKSGGTYLPTQLMLLFLGELDHNGSTFWAVLKAFQKYVPSNLKKMYEYEQDFFSNFISRFKGQKNQGIFETEIQKKMDETEITYQGNDTIYTHAKDVRFFLTTGKFWNGRNPDNVERVSGGGGGCFTKGTQVMLLESGKTISKDVESIDTNDVVISAGGDLSVTSDEKPVTSYVDHPNVVFSFNDEEPFFTASHPFWTESGWKSLHPSFAMEESKVLNVSQLHVGDKVFRIVDFSKPLIAPIAESSPVNVPLQYELVEVKRINQKLMPPPMSVHGVHLRDGPHSYHANGYLVAVTYPETTPTRVVEGARKYLDMMDRTKLCPKLQELRPIFSNVLGEDTMRALDQEYIASSTSKTLPVTPKVLAIEAAKRKEIKTTSTASIEGTMASNESVVGSQWDNLRLRMWSHSNINEKNVPAEYLIPKGVSVHGGDILVGGVKCEQSAISASKLWWRRPIDREFIEVGCVKLHESGCFGNGRVFISRAENNLVVEELHVNVELKQREFYEREGRFIVRLINAKGDRDIPLELLCEILSPSREVIGSGISYRAQGRKGLLGLTFTFNPLHETGFKECTAILNHDFSGFEGVLHHCGGSVPGSTGYEEMVKMRAPHDFELRRCNETIRTASLLELGDRTFSVVAQKKPAGGTYSLSIHDRMLYVNGEPVTSHAYENHNLTWTRNVGGDSIESGAVKLEAPIYLRGSGTLSYSKRDGSSQTEDVFKIDVLSSLEQYISVDGKEWDYYVEMGYYADGETFAWLKDPSGNVFEYATVRLITINKWNLMYMIEVTQSACEILGIRYINGEGIMNDFGTESSGHMHEYDHTALGKEGAEVTMTGNYKRQGVRSTATISFPLLKFPQSLAREKQMDVNSVHTMLSSKTTPIVEDLVNMAPPDQNAVTEMSQEKIVAWAQYCMTDEQRDLLNIQKPTLPKGEVDFIMQDDILKFFRDVYAKAYIAMGLNGMTEFEDEWTKKVNVDQQLQFFWKGAVNGTIGGYTEYTMINDFAGKKAFLDNMKSQMDPFMGPEKGKWAKKLYDTLTAEAMFNTLIVQYIYGDTSQLLKYSNQLFCLDSSQNYSAALWSEVAWGSAVQNIGDMTEEDRDALDEFIAMGFRKIIIAILNDDGTIFGDLAKEAKGALQELQVDMTQDLEKIAIDAQVRLQDFGIALEVALRNEPSSSLTKKISSAMKPINKKYPRFKLSVEFGANVMALVGLGYSLFTIYSTMMDWDDLSLENKVLSVVGALTATADGVVSFVDTVDGMRNIVRGYRKPTGDLNKVLKGDSLMRKNCKQVGPAKNVSKTSDKIAVKLDKSLAKQKNPGLQRTGSKLSKIAAKNGDGAVTKMMSKAFNAVKKFAKGMNVLMLAATTVVLGFQVADNFKNGAPLSLKIIDTVNLVVTGLATAIAFGSFVLGSSIPGIGTALIVVGVVLSIVSTILHKLKPPPKTPHEQWIIDVGNPFVLDIPQVTADFALTQLDLKPTPFMMEGKTEKAWISNLLDTTVENADISCSGTFIPKSDDVCAAYRSSNNAVNLSVSIKGSIDPMYAYFISSVRLTKFDTSNAEVWKKGWVDAGSNLSSAQPQEGFYMYRCIQEILGGKWTVDLSTNTQFTVSIARQDEDVEHTSLSEGLPPIL